MDLSGIWPKRTLRLAVEDFCFVPIPDMATAPKRTLRANAPGQRNWAFHVLAIAELPPDAQSSSLLDYMMRTP